MTHGRPLEHADLQLTRLSRGERWMRPDDVAAFTKRAKEKIPPKRPAEGLCLACHNPENDGHFFYPGLAGRRIIRPRAS